MEHLAANKRDVMKEKIIKPQLHQSHLSLLYRCGYKFSRIVLEGDREPSTIPLIVGSATHTATAQNLTNKKDKGTLMTKEDMQDCSRDSFISEWQESSVMLNDDEKAQGLNRTKGAAQDQTIQLVGAHHYELAPKIQPIAIERKWVLAAPDYPYDMAGTIDIDEEKRIFVGDGKDWITKSGIRDTKTRKTNLGQKEVDYSEQYTFYALAKFMLDGKMPDYVAQDNILKPTKRRDAYCISYESTRTKDDFKVVMKRFDQANKIIKAGIFTPANQADWWCSKDFCGFAADGSCPFYNSKARKPVENPIIKKGGKENDRGKEGIIERLERTLSKK